MSNYITEAFKAMNLLESEDITLNADGAEELEGFMSEAGVDPDEEIVDVFDLEAEAQDELKDSYVGKVILECAVCHSDVFIDRAEISTDVDEEGLACKDLECPYCMSNEGYTIIGEIAPFDQEKSDELIDPEEAVEEEELPEVDVEGAVEEVEEEDLEDKEDEEDLEESLNEGADCAEEEKIEESLLESENYALKGEYIFKKGNEEPIGRFYDSKGSYSIYDGHEDEDEEEIKTLVHEGMKLDGKEELYKDQQLRGVDGLKGVDALEGSDEIRGPIHKTHMNEGAGCEEEKIEESCEDGEKCEESLEEGLESATIETEDETINLSQGEDGSVSLEATPKEDFGEFGAETPELAGGDEMIVPLADETVDEVEAAADANSVEEGEDNIDYEELAEEEFPMEDEFEDFDEESFNGLGESYLKSCYENVTGFKTTGIAVKESKLMIEGIIKFDSGNIKETNFVFESVEPGKYEGYNKQISRGNKTFKLNTSVDNKKLVCESLNYNYRSKNEDNESVRVYGTVKRKENK